MERRIDRSGRIGVPPVAPPPFKTVGTSGIRPGRLLRWLELLIKLAAILDLGAQSRLARTPPPGLVKPPFQLPRRPMPKIHMGHRTDSIDQVDPGGSRWLV